MVSKQILSAKKVIAEFNRRASERKGIIKVLSDRFGIRENEEFDEACNEFIKKNFFSKPNKLKTIIDIGTGIGRLSRLFAQKNSYIVGIDFSDKILSLSSQYLSKKDNIILINSDAADINFLPGYFDLGIVSLVLKHNNTKRAIKIIEKLKKWCKQILLIEHVSGGASGSNIAVMRSEVWYIKHFKPLKLKQIERYKRHNDDIIFCIFKR